MDCNKYRENLHGFAAGNLSELENKAIIKHLKACEKCRKEVDEIREIRRLLKCSSESVVFPPIDLKSNIMSSINLKKYKNTYKATLGELTNWGMSLVAAGLILLFINITPTDNIAKAHKELDIDSVSITQKIYQPFSLISKGLDSVTEKIMKLDGISGRIERQIKGGK